MIEFPNQQEKIDVPYWGEGSLDSHDLMLRRTYGSDGPPQQLSG